MANGNINLKIEFECLEFKCCERKRKMKKEFEIIIYLKNGSQLKTVENKIEYIDTGIWIFDKEIDTFIPYSSIDFVNRICKDNK